MSRPSFGELDGRDPYEILELRRGASDADVRAARKRLLRRYHPDLPGGDLRRTQLITAAADLLLDPLRRIGYYDLRDGESRRTVFATADVADDGYQATRPDHGPGEGTGPAEPIRPTFITPPGRPSPWQASPFPRTRAAPGPGWEQVPRPGREQAPRPGREQAPGPGREQTPRPGREHVPGPRQEQVPGPRRERTPRPGWEQAPGAAGQKPPPARVDHGYRDVAGGPAAASRWNALAIASVVAILTWTPIPLILGLLALRQIRRYGQRGKRLARTGVIVGAVFVLVYLYVLVVPNF